MRYCSIVLCLLILISCSHPIESTQEYFKKRGIQYIKIGDTELTTRLLNRSGSSDSSYSNSSFIYFDVTIKRLAGDKFTKDKAVYLDFDMQKDFMVAASNDSLQASFCQKIENGKSENYEYIVAFEKPLNLDVTGLTLLYDDKIFGIGKLAFVYEANELKNLEPKS